ncbi:MAG: hypothetical protein ACTS6P_02130 [Candidatus Hodgkinia cicadicola]
MIKRSNGFFSKLTTERMVTMFRRGGRGERAEMFGRLICFEKNGRSIV